MREKVTLEDTLQDVIVKMSEGNPGALTTLISLAKEPDGLMLILDLDDMNIRGLQICVGFSDVADKDFDKFKELVRKRDKDMVRKINEEMRMDNSFKERARLNRYDKNLVP